MSLLPSFATRLPGPSGSLWALLALLLLLTPPRPLASGESSQPVGRTRQSGAPQPLQRGGVLGAGRCPEPSLLQGSFPATCPITVSLFLPQLVLPRPSWESCVASVYPSHPWFIPKWSVIWRWSLQARSARTWNWCKSSYTPVSIVTLPGTSAPAASGRILIFFFFFFFFPAEPPWRTGRESVWTQKPLWSRKSSRKFWAGTWHFGLCGFLNLWECSFCKDVILCMCLATTSQCILEIKGLFRRKWKVISELPGKIFINDLACNSLPKWLCRIRD